MLFFSRDPNSRSHPGRSDVGSRSQHLIQPQGTYRRFRISLCGLFRKFSRQENPLQDADVIPLGERKTVLDGHEQHTLASVDFVKDIPQELATPHRDSFSPTSIQVEGRNPFPTVVEPTTVPVATQLGGAQGFTISGNPTMTNIGVNTGNLTTINHYGGTHGLEKLEKFVSFAALYNSSEQDPNRRCHPGTREKVLRQLGDWIDNLNSTNRIFWLYGPAGAGKSAIAQTIAHRYNQGEVTATFFFFRSDSGRNDGNRLFPTIAWQLAFSIQVTKDSIAHTLGKTPHLPMSNVETQFEHLVAHVFRSTNNITSQMPHPAPVVIIDGIDECSDEQLQCRILAVIGNAVKDCRVPLRFLIISRPEAHIKDTLKQFQDFTFRIDLATVDDSDRDIEKYLKHNFSAIASKQGLATAWPDQEVINEIVFKSSGNFILPSTLIRFISDEECSAVSQLDIVRKLKPHGTTSPFALLDELYLEIVKQPRDQEFLKTFLALLVGRSSIKGDIRGLEKDDATLMDVSEQELHIKLRRMRSLLKFEPFIDVYHKSFLDFLQDPSRSGQYHVSKQNGLKQYLELIVSSVVRHVSMATEQPNCHETCCSSPRFKRIVRDYPPKLVLPVEDWQEALKPLLDLQTKLFSTLKPQPCRVVQVMRDLQLHLVILQRISHHIAAVEAPGSSTHETVTERTPTLVTEVRQDIPEMDSDSFLSVLLSCLQETNSLLTIDTAIINRFSSLLASDYAQTAARVRSLSDAQRLIDLIDLITNNRMFFNQWSPDARRNATRLVSEILTKGPLLPSSFFVNKPTHCSDLHRMFGSCTLEFVSQSMFIGKILDHNYIAPLLGKYDAKEDRLRFVRGSATEQYQSVDEWLRGSRPKLVTRIRVMLEVARVIRYVHSMDIALYSRFIRLEHLFLEDSNLRTKILFFGLFAWWQREASIYGYGDSVLLANCTYESNVSMFADLFHSVCFADENALKQYTLRKSVKKAARRLIKWCRATDPKSRPTMEDVVRRMETWNLT